MDCTEYSADYSGIYVKLVSRAGLVKDQAFASEKPYWWAVEHTAHSGFQVSDSGSLGQPIEGLSCAREYTSLAVLGAKLLTVVSGN